MLEQKQQWIQKHVERYRREAHKYNSLDRIPYYGEWYVIKQSGNTRKGTVRINDESRTFFIDSVSLEEEHLKKVIRNKLRAVAKKKVPELVTAWSKKLNIPYAAVSVRNQKTRWGSSSGKGHISINWRIICTPPKVQEYLIVHELLHQQHHNHSKTYWASLEKYFPDAKKCNDWLKQHDMIMSFLRD